MEKKLTVVIADGSADFCNQLEQMLMKCGEFEIIGTVHDGE